MDTAKEYRFMAYALAGELDLNRIGPLLGISRKYRWEEPMVLSPATLRPLADDRSGERREDRPWN